MHQICDGYNPRVRMGNWFQQSYSVRQAARQNPIKASRDTEIDIGYIDAHLKLRPLNRMARLPPWNTSGLIQAPQFSNLNSKTTMKQNFDLGINGNYFQPWKPYVYDKNCASGSTKQNSIKVNQFKRNFNILDQSNVGEMIAERDFNTTSFRSELRPAYHAQQKELLQTIYQSDISQKEAFAQQKMNEKKQLQNNGANTLEKPAFRRIRSEITLKNTPPITTYK